MHRRRFLKGGLSGFGLSLIAGCTGSSGTEEEEPTINENESYGFQREGVTHDYQPNQQNEIAYGDAINLGDVVLYAKGIEWGDIEYNHTAQVYFEWHNITNSTLNSYNSDSFSLYESGTNTEMKSDSVAEDPYTGSNQVQPKQADTGYLAFRIPDEYESLDVFRFTLYVPAERLEGDQDVDVAWTVNQDGS